MHKSSLFPAFMAAAILSTQPVSAHARLLKSLPAAGAMVRSPLHVVLTFSEPLEPAFSGALLLDKDGRNLSGAPVAVDGTVMTLTPGRLTPGRYRVAWHSVGHDTHRLDGQVWFSVRP